MDRGKSSKAGAVIAVIALVVVVAGAYFAYSALSGAAGPTGSASPSSAASQAGNAAVSASSSQAGSTGAWSDRAFASLTMLDADGNPVMMEEAANGRPTVVNVWATWCPYCIDEMQDFQALYDKYGDRIQFVMLDAADRTSELSKAQDFVKEQGFTFPVFYDVNWEVQRFFGIRGLPATIVIDGNGEVVYSKAGRIVAASLDEVLAGLAG